jgi:PAS domain S-box-containing protein
MRYGLAVLSVAVSLGTALVLEHLHFRDAAAPLLLFAVAVSSWYGGRGPAVLAVILSTGSFYWYFIEPVRTIYIYPSEIPYFIIFVSFAALLSWFSTIRRRAEEDLRKQADLLNLTHDTVFVMDMEEVIRYWNLGAQERYGWTAEEAVGRVVHDLLKTVFPLPLEEIKAELLRTGRWEGELVHTKKDGTQVVVASRWALQRGEQGAPVAILETNNDITERKRAEEALRHSNRELRALSNCNQTLLRATDEQSLLEEICRIVCEEAGYGLAWVSYVEHDESKSMRPVAWAGTDEAYLATARISWSEDTDRGRGPTGMAVRSGKSCCVQDFATDARVAPWRETLLQSGFRSAIALPLKGEQGNAFGSLTIHSAQPNAFTPEEIRLLEELAGDLAFGIVTLRSRAARQRAEQEVALLSFALNNVREAALLVDEGARLHYVNEEACRVLGYTREELLGMSVPDIDPRFPKEGWSDHWRALNAQRFLSFESLHRTKEGRVFPVEISANYLEYGGAAYNLALVRDISERKEAEEKIRQQELEQQQVLDFALQQVAVFGPDRERLYANRPALDYFGVTLEEWQGIKDRFWFFHPDDRERLARDVSTGPARDVPREFEARLRGKDGTYRWFLLRDNSLRDEQGRITRWYLSAMDIEDRKRAEEERRAHVWILESMDRINRALQGTNDLEQMTGDVIGAMRSIFDSDRAFLYYPCDPDAPSFEVVMARHRPEYPAATGVFPMTADTARGFQIMLASSGVVTFGPGSDHPLIGDFTKRFGHQSSIGIALYPKTGKPWVLAMHQCSSPRVWTPDERKLLEEIARQLADSLTSLLMFRSLGESEQALREQANLLNLTHDTVFVMDGEGVVKYWNRGAEERYGWPAEQALGRVVHDLLKTVFPSPLSQIKAELMRTGHWEAELVHTRRNGTQVVVASRWALQRDEEGAPFAILETNNDITARKRTEEALRLSNAYNRSLIETSLDPLVTIGPDGKITDVNAATEAATGRSRGELIGTDFCDYFTEPAKARAGYEQVFRDGTVRNYPLELRHHDGHVMSVLYNASVYRDDSGQVVGVFAAARDITERMRAEEARRESETLFRTFVDHAADALFMLDFEDGTIIDVNRCACESLGYTREELIGMTPLAFDVDLDRATFESIAERAATGETVLFDRHWHRRKDGSLYPVEVQTSTFWHEGRHFLLKVARDISDRLRAEEQREKLQQLEADLWHLNRVSTMGEMAASIAHEINQPLSGVVSNGSACLRWLARDPPNVEEAREAARRIVGGGQHAGEIIKRIRALTSRTATLREKLDLNETIGGVLALVGDEAKRNRVMIRAQFANDLAPVSGDRVQLQQVVLNLAVNAIEALSSISERARELVITTRNIDADRVQVTVEDSGTGLDPSTLDRIFESFYTTKPGGMGMGLSISRSIVQAHGGRLWATARNGPGTMFHFTLPKCHEEGSNAGL